MQRSSPRTDAVAIRGRLSMTVAAFGSRIATTLARWREDFIANLPGVPALALPENFVRMWEFKFCCREDGFAERALGDVQVLLVKED